MREVHVHASLGLKYVALIFSLENEPLPSHSFSDETTAHADRPVTKGMRITGIPLLDTVSWEAIASESRSLKQAQHASEVSDFCCNN